MSNELNQIREEISKNAAKSFRPIRNFPKQIVEELDRRRLDVGFNPVELNTYNKDYKGPRSVWIRATSNVKPGFIFHGQNSFEDIYGYSLVDGEYKGNVVGLKFDGEPHKLKNDKYLGVPSPIITGFELDTTTSNYTLNEGVLKFKCFSPEQVDYLEKYWFKVAISCIVEFGWSNFNRQSLAYNIGDSIEKITKSLTPFFFNESETKNPSVEILSREYLSRGNYSCIAGIIKRYEISPSKNASFDCSVTIVSPSALFQSLPVSDINKNEQISDNIQDTMDAQFVGKYFSPIKTKRTSGKVDVESSWESKKYISMYHIQQYLNETFSRKSVGLSSNNPVICDLNFMVDLFCNENLCSNSLKVLIPSRKIPTKIFESKKAFEVKPILSLTENYKSIYGFKDNENFASFDLFNYIVDYRDETGNDLKGLLDIEHIDEKGNIIHPLQPFPREKDDNLFEESSNPKNIKVGYLSSIFIDYDYFKSLFKQSTTVQAILMILLNEISNSTNNIWKFNVIADSMDDIAKLRVTVENFHGSPEGGEYVFDKDAYSIIRNASTTFAPATHQYLEIFDGNKSQDQRSNDDIMFSKTVTPISEKIQKLINKNIKGDSALHKDKDFLPIKFKKPSEHFSITVIPHKHICATINSFVLNEAEQKHYVTSVIPNKVNLELDGIAGLGLDHVFKLNFLPESFRDKFVYRVMKNRHSVTPSDWSTTIEGFGIIVQ